MIGVKLNWTVISTGPDGAAVSARTKQTGARIFRQRGGRAGEAHVWSTSWFCSRAQNGKRTLFSLGPDEAGAIKTADQISSFLRLPGSTLDEAIARFNPRALRRDSNFSTIGEMLELHEANLSILELKERTAENYYSSLMNILRHVYAWRKGEELEPTSGRRNIRETEWPKWTKLSLTVLNDALLTDYKRLMLEGEDGDELDKEQLLTAKITADSNMRQARALFGKEAMKIYRAQHLAIPDLSGFMEVSLFNAKKYFELAPASVARRIFADAPALKKSDLGAYRFLVAALHCGMRKSEILALQMPWLENEDPPTIKLREKGEFEPKHGHGRTIELQPWVYAELKEITASPASFTGDKAADREEACARLVAWLQDRGVEASKPLHELRKLWGCYISKTRGLLAAQKMLGHHDANTTSNFYADNRLAGDLIPFWSGQPTSDAQPKKAKRKAR